MDVSVKGKDAFIAAPRAHLMAKGTASVLLAKGLPLESEREREAIIRAVQQGFGIART